MPYYGQITGTYNGVEGSWLIELDDTGAPISEYEFIPVASMPDVVPVWSIELPIRADAGVVFTEDQTANLALIKWYCGRLDIGPLQRRLTRSWDRSMIAPRLLSARVSLRVLRRPLLGMHLCTGGDRPVSHAVVNWGSTYSLLMTACICTASSRRDGRWP